MGFAIEGKSNGVLIYKARGWNYPELCKTFEEGLTICRRDHIPVVFHITELTQPLGHSTSGSHERYKSSERLNWEKEFDPLKKFRDWILDEKIANSQELDEIESQTVKEVLSSKEKAWKAFNEPLIKEKNRLLNLIEQKGCKCSAGKQELIDTLTNELKEIAFPIRKDLISTAKKIFRQVCISCSSNKYLRSELKKWIRKIPWMEFNVTAAICIMIPYGLL